MYNAIRQCIGLLSTIFLLYYTHLCYWERPSFTTYLRIAVYFSIIYNAKLRVVWQVKIYHKLRDSIKVIFFSIATFYMCKN